MFFFLFRVVFKHFSTISVAIENARLKLTLKTKVIPTGAPITVANDAIEMPPLVADKTIKDLSKWSKYIYWVSLINSLSVISATK